MNLALFLLGIDCILGSLSLFGLTVDIKLVLIILFIVGILLVGESIRPGIVTVRRPTRN